MMPNDFTTYNADSVVAINCEDEASQTTVYNGMVDAYNDGESIQAGALVVTSTSSEVNARLVEFPAAKGGLVTEIVRYAQVNYEDDETFREKPLQTYKLTPKLELLVPESNIGTGAGTINPGDLLIADVDGTYAKQAQATDHVVFQALSTGVEGGAGSFRVMVIAGQV